MQKQTNSQLEFIVLMACLMSLVALAIDALLPALSSIGKDIGIKDTNKNQLLITMIFLGLGFGQLIAGPISDALGRKPVIYYGFGLFFIASFICTTASSLEIMIIGRILQGVGLSAPRTISIAMIRDRFTGNYMARIMSFVVVIFILVPVVAPAIGKLILGIFNWKMIFYSQLLFGILVVLWLWKRQPETLKPAYTKKFTLQLFIEGTKEFLKYKSAIIFTLISGLIMGSFMVYLSASQKIFEEQYALKEQFPYIFAALAIGLGLATFLNGTLVLKYGMFKLVWVFTICYVLSSVLYVILFFGKENPKAFVLLLFFLIQFFSIGFLFGNLRSLAMQPVGHIAGVGAAINGFVSTIMAVPIATYIGSFVKTTSLPLFIGFFICGILSLFLLIFVKKEYANH